MSVYSEPLDHQLLLERLAKAKRVLILGCPYCASLSISYYRGIPFYKISRHPTWTNGVAEEAHEIKELLEKDGKSVEIYGLSVIGSPYCRPDPLKEKIIKKKAQIADTVLVLSCVGGLVGVSQTLRDMHDKKIVHGMKTLGCGTFRLKWKPPFSFVIDKKSAKVSKVQGE